MKMQRPSELQQAIDRYLTFLQSEQNRSPGTIQRYRASLEFTAKLLGVNDPSRIDKVTVRKFKTELHGYRTRKGSELAVRTKNHHTTILRAFLRYLTQEEERDVYPPDRIHRLKEEERKVKVLSLEEVERLLSAPDTRTRLGKRDKAILEVLFATGLRLQELRQLNRKDINFKTREIPIRGKGRKVRLVFLTDRAGKALKEYLDARLDHLEALFIRGDKDATHALPPGEEFRLSRTAIWGIVKKYAALTGIAIDPSPHTLRHSFGTELLRNGAGLRSVQELLGHKNLATTQIYTHVTNPELKDIHRQCHPGQKECL